MKNIIYLSFSLLLLLTSCASEKTVQYTIASQKGDCVGVTPQKCMLIKKGNSVNWAFFYSNIVGFNYHEGYEYVLDVKEEAVKNVPADASSIKYTLVKEVSKIEKTSEGLPFSVAPKIEGYQLTGKVISVSSTDVGKGAAAGKVPVRVVELKVTSSVNADISGGDIIYCELIAKPKVMPVADREYVFKAKHLHPAHAKGTYMLETDVLDLTR